jgi:hypothetical protein
VLVEVSPQPDSTLQLAAIAETTRARRLFRWCVDHQRIVTAFVTNLRGPLERMTFLGATITLCLSR